MYADIFKNRALRYPRARFHIKNLFNFYKKSNKLFHKLFYKSASAEGDEAVAVGEVADDPDIA